MWYIGLDAHHRQSTFCILDDNGKVLRTQTVHGSWESVLRELRQIKTPWRICYEASCGYGWLYERLKGMAQSVQVAHPGHLRMIFRSKRKNDRVDAQKLAKLLYLDEVPLVHVPSGEVRSWRSMIEHRQKLLQERVRIKNTLRALLRTHGVAAPKKLWSKAGLRWIGEQSFPTLLDALQRDILLERLGSVQAMMGRVEKALKAVAQKSAGVELLRSIPGVGIRTAEAVMAYVDDPARFGSVKDYAAYFGLAPCQDASAGKNHLGHITRQGPATVRKLLTEASWQGIRRSRTFRAYYERIRQDDPDRKKIALIATAHYLLRVMAAMLRTGEVWRGEAA